MGKKTKKKKVPRKERQTISKELAKRRKQWRGLDWKKETTP